tara:strand:+ start:469 stop:813 length:345 start_codon:yes stop_codon:yes gene_type:complete
MKHIFVTIILMSFINCYSQDYKDGISVVQFSASFTENSEISLSKFEDYNTHKFLIDNQTEIFSKENILYLPTVVLYHNGDEITRVESGVTLKLPSDCIETILKHIEKIVESKFL